MRAMRPTRPELITRFLLPSMEHLRVFLLSLPTTPHPTHEKMNGMRVQRRVTPSSMLLVPFYTPVPGFLKLS